MSRHISVAQREKWLLQKEPVQRHRRVSDSRGVARSDICVDLGETGGVRIRTLPGMCEAFEGNAELLGAAGRKAGCDALPSHKGPFERACSQARHDWQVWFGEIESERKAICDEETAYFALRGGEGGQSGHTQKKRQWLASNTHRKKQLQRMRTEGELAMERLDAVMQKPPTMDIVRSANLQLRAELDADIGCVKHDHRPLSRQFPGMSLAEVDLKVTSLEIDESLVTHKPLKSRESSRDTSSHAWGKGGRARGCDSGPKPRVRGARRYLMNRMKQTGLPPSVSFGEQSFHLAGRFALPVKKGDVQ